MSRVLGYVLTVGNVDGWRGFAVVAMARMSIQERACLAKAALLSLPEDVVDLVVSRQTCSPIPPFLALMADARFWASNATRKEKKAYALAAFEAMSDSDQVAFFKYIKKSKDLFA